MVLPANSKRSDESLCSLGPQAPQSIVLQDEHPLEGSVQVWSSQHPWKLYPQGQRACKAFWSRAGGQSSGAGAHLTSRWGVRAIVQQLGLVTAALGVFCFSEEVSLWPYHSTYLVPGWAYMSFSCRLNLEVVHPRGPYHLPLRSGWEAGAACEEGRVSAGRWTVNIKLGAVTFDVSVWGFLWAIPPALLSLHFYLNGLTARWAGHPF